MTKPLMMKEQFDAEMSRPHVEGERRAP